MDETPLAGGLGVKMVNGEGSFLPESKRGLPLPSVAFYKIFGLSKVFKNPVVSANIILRILTAMKLMRLKCFQEPLCFCENRY